MQTDYKRDMKKSWVVFTGEPEQKGETYALRMISENDIPGLLPCRPALIDGTLRLYFDITARHSLSDILEAGQAGYGLLQELFSSIADVFETLDEYFLPPEGLLLSVENIFLDSGCRDIRFCYFPGREGSLKIELGRFAASLLPHLDRGDGAALVAGYGFCSAVRSEEFGVASIRELISSKEMHEKEIPEERPASREELERAAALDAFFLDDEDSGQKEGLFARIKSVFRRRKKHDDQTGGGEHAYADPRPGSSAAGYGESRSGGGAGPGIKKTVPARAGYGSGMSVSASGGRETVLLDASYLERRQAACMLRRIGGDREEFMLANDKVIIGKSEAGADIDIGSPAVSRLHACLRRQGDTYTIRDMNSRNGTWIGQKQIVPGQELLLRDGDMIRLADVTLRFERGGA